MHKDLYTSSFYNFNTQEEYWAYWANHINFANLSMSGTKLYKEIFKVVREKDYFVITTNVDDQFYKSGFDKCKIFRVQGSYALNQCAKACHNKLYSNKEIVLDMLQNIDEDLKIPSRLVPKCPVCKGDMEPNLRKDEYFVQDEIWYMQSDRYKEFIQKNKGNQVVMLEFGVGFNTPGIIRFPFEKMLIQNKNWTLIRFNRDSKNFFDIDEDRYIEYKEDINKMFE